MRQELYNKLRERIVKVVPEIMELKFGCKMNDDEIFLSESDGGIGNCVAHIFTPTDGEVRSILVNHKDNGELETLEDLVECGDLEILGRDIQLADILRVFCHFSTPELEIGVGGAPSKNLSYALLSYKNGKKKLSAMWMLAKPLHEQSDELGKWLRAVIK